MKTVGVKPIASRVQEFVEKLPIMSLPIWLFKFWQFIPYIPITCILGLVVLVFVTVVFVVIPLCPIVIVVCGICASESVDECIDHCFSCCSGLRKQIELYRLKLIQVAGRHLCPWMFPDLFTLHMMKTQAQNSSESTSRSEHFVVFLNRKVENDRVIISSFAFMSIAVLLASAMAFFTSVPRVTYDTQCLEKNSNNHPLYCYTYESNYPINCTSLTDQERSKEEYTCYAWTLDIFSIACVAAVTVFKLAIKIATYYVRFGEMWLKACKNRKCINGVCKP